METADAGVSEHEVAIWVSTYEEDVFVVVAAAMMVVLLFFFFLGLVNDEDVLEDCVVLQHCEHWDFPLLF